MPTARGPARWGRRLVATAAALAVGWFAVQGGEYGTTDLVRLRDRRATLEGQVAILRRQVDSLTTYRTSVLRDRATQERLAREAFGMVHGDRELLYRFAPARADGSGPPPADRYPPHAEPPVPPPARG